ncbi:hypothetical protein RJ641_025306 [Dillenia turbinata]|uniref:Uncharacterized protein n=1 Tax=Dillenia turbinata TaxID=194707 RepID=A0AAN8ZJY5_9MAGN
MEREGRWETKQRLEEEEEEERVGSASAVAKSPVPMRRPHPSMILRRFQILRELSHPFHQLRRSPPYAYFLYTPQLTASPSLRQSWGSISNPTPFPRPEFADLVLFQSGCHCECSVEAEFPCWN